jgi:hypothetical protein
LEVRRQKSEVMELGAESIKLGADRWQQEVGGLRLEAKKMSGTRGSGVGAAAGLKSG